MKLALDEDALVDELRPLLDAPDCRTGIATLTGDPFFLAFFLVSVSQGEGLGEKAVGMIGQEELAARIHDLDRQEREERAHKERTVDAARRLFPQFFEGDAYRHPDSLQGRSYYVAVLEANRRRLEERARFSRLNLYLTTTFAYEVMVVLLYRAVADALAHSPLDPVVTREVAGVIDGILAEEETHLGLIEQHNALLTGARDGLTDPARSLLDALDRLDEDDYRVPAEHAVRQVVEMMSAYTDAEGFRRQIEAGAAG